VVFVKKILLSACVCLSFGANSNVIITEYVEGSGNNKAIEISNLSSETVNLYEQGYRIALYNNGGTSVTNSLDLYGTLPSNASLVIYNSGASSEFVFTSPLGIASNVTYFNGDDALVLYKGDEVVDRFGQLGSDPGDEWIDSSDSSLHTQNITLRRKSTITNGDTEPTSSFDDLSLQWVALEVDTWQGLGCTGEESCTGNEPQALAEGEHGELISDDELCTNCPDVDKIQSADDFVEADYYATTSNLTGSELKLALTDIIQSHRQLTYTELWTVLTETDQDPNVADNIVLLYSGKSVAKNSNGSGTKSSDPDAWNREHVWSKSHGFPDTDQMAYTDAHHIRPADASLNTLRSNYDFDEGGEAVQEAPENNYSVANNTWQPRAEVRGDVARMMFYMDVRYEGQEEDNTPNLMLVDRIGNDSGEPYFGKLCTLYDWHMTDIVDEFELNRNNVIFEYQGNRNPFIDHPEWVDEIYGARCDENNPGTPPVIVLSGIMDVTSGETISISAADSHDAELDELSFDWSQLSGPSVSFTSNNASLTLIAPDVDSVTTLTFELAVSDGKNTVSETIQVNVSPVAKSASGGSTMLLLFLSLLLLVRTNRS
jgi:endonuclease I